MFYKAFEQKFNKNLLNVFPSFFVDFIVTNFLTRLCVWQQQHVGNSLIQKIKEVISYFFPF